jgi:hypothetical protein
MNWGYGGCHGQSFNETTPAANRQAQVASRAAWGILASCAGFRLPLYGPQLRTQPQKMHSDLAPGSPLLTPKSPNYDSLKLDLPPEWQTSNINDGY